MLRTLNISTHPGDLAIIGNDWAKAADLLRDEGLDGFELYPVGDYPWTQIPRGMTPGLHLRFYPILAPFWRGDRRRLIEIFGDDETIATFYGGLTREALVHDYQSQLTIAHDLGCEYVVFHLAQSEFDHVYDWRFPWSWRDTVDLCAELLREVFADTPFSGELLLENLWWPGSFRALAPEEIDYALERVDYPRSAIVLDTGHLLSTNQGIGSEAEGIAFLLDAVESLGEARKSIHGVHLTKSLSAEYVRRTQPAPAPASGTFWDRYQQAIEHVQRIDQHDAFDDPAIARLFELINPAYVTYEFSYASRGEWLDKIRRQRRAMEGA
jgi:sugar phosphate isomerase/epimerase